MLSLFSLLIISLKLYRKQVMLMILSNQEFNLRIIQVKFFKLKIKKSIIKQDSNFVVSQSFIMCDHTINFQSIGLQGPLPPRTRGTHLTVTHGTHCHPNHPHPDLPIKHTWHAFPDYLKKDQTTLINISSGRLTQYIRMINIFHPDTMVRIID